MYCFTSCFVFSQNDKQKDLTGYTAYVASQTNSDYFSSEDHERWAHYLNQAHPNVKTINRYFEDAGAEFGVPPELLKVIGQVESNWTQIGPSIDRGWGIMHLVENSYCNTLGDAASVLQVSKDVLKNNPQQNIRGAAALLSQYYKEVDDNNSDWQKWFEASKKISGLINDQLREQQAIFYFKKLRQGVLSRTVWDEQILIYAKSDLYRPETSKKKLINSVDYPPAISNIISACSISSNFSTNRSQAIDTWVNHWIGVGTYAGAISYFHTCPCDRYFDPQFNSFCAANPCSCPSSAHFIVSNNGEITQTVAIVNEAFHAGASGGPGNNDRSIGVEHEATLANPSQWASIPMLTASTDMACYLLAPNNIPVVRSLPGIQEHNEMPGTNTQCAGNIPWTTWMDMLGACLNGTSCPDNEIIANNTTGVIQVSDYILSSGGVAGGNNTVYDAGNYIDLISGFEGQAGSVFEGKIEGCTQALQAKVNHELSIMHHGHNHGH